MNNCLRFGHIINVEARCLHGTAADVPALGRYVAEALRVRRLLRDVLWDSKLIEPIDIEVQGAPDLLYSLHQSRVDNRQALVLNHFQPTELSTTVNHKACSGAVTLYRPFKAPETISVPSAISVPRDEFAILVFS